MNTDEPVPASVAAAGPAFRNAWLTLRRQYASQLPQKLQEARDALAECLRQPQDVDALQHLRRLMHTMAGTAPTLGFESHGSHARVVERLLHGLADRPSRTESDFAPVQSALAELQALGAAK